MRSPISDVPKVNVSLLYLKLNILLKNLTIVANISDICYKVLLVISQNKNSYFFVIADYMRK